MIINKRIKKDKLKRISTEMVMKVIHDNLITKGYVTTSENSNVICFRDTKSRLSKGKYDKNNAHKLLKGGSCTVISNDEYVLIKWKIDVFFPIMIYLLSLFAVGIYCWRYADAQISMIVLGSVFFIMPCFLYLLLRNKVASFIPQLTVEL